MLLLPVKQPRTSPQSTYSTILTVPITCILIQKHKIEHKLQCYRNRIVEVYEIINHRMFGTWWMPSTWLVGFGPAVKWQLDVMNGFVFSALLCSTLHIKRLRDSCTARPNLARFVSFTIGRRAVVVLVTTDFKAQ